MDSRTHSQHSSVDEQAPSAESEPSQKAAAKPEASPVSEALEALAERVGVLIEWQDSDGKPCTLDTSRLRRVLAAMGHACDSDEQCAATLDAIGPPPDAKLVTARVGETIDVGLPAWCANAPSLDATLRLESGAAVDVRLVRTARGASDGAVAWSMQPVADIGYHRLTVRLGEHEHALTLAIAPRRVYGVADALRNQQSRAGESGRARLWGNAVQLYALRPESTRSTPDVGVGDFTSLATCARAAAAQGADLLLVSPIHASMFPDRKTYSPYSPSSRLRYNVTHIDPTAWYGEQAAMQAFHRAGLAAESAALGEAELIDWHAAASVKRRWLRALYESVGPQLASEPAEGVSTSAERDSMPGNFASFRASADASLEQHARFEALHAHFASAGLADWHDWPPEYRDPRSEQVAQFARDHEREVTFHAFLQWLAEAGAQRAADAARDAGMAIGLVGDLAVGLDHRGSDAWRFGEGLLSGVQIGAPPDTLDAKGQAWGLRAFSPEFLRSTGLAPYIEMLRAAMRHAGGVRIDHVPGLSRLWMVPDGAEPDQGAYLRYPLTDLVNLVSLESHRNRAIVIGEDIGTVPREVQELSATSGLMGMRMLWFEPEAADAADKGSLELEWPIEAVALTATHDMPTVAGWWLGRDIDWRSDLHLQDDEATRDAREHRARQRDALVKWARKHGLARGDDAPDDYGLRDVVDLGVSFASVSRPCLAVVPLDDLLGLEEQPNLPGSVDEHPNWRRRMPLPVDQIYQDADARRRCALLQKRRTADG